MSTFIVCHESCVHYKHAGEIDIFLAEQIVHARKYDADEIYAHWLRAIEVNRPYLS